MADGHLNQSQMANSGLFETSDDTWSQKSTLVYTLNPELMCIPMVTDVQICQSHNLLRNCIYSNNL